MDLSCDLGEGESLARTRALLRQVTSANIACGGHAGEVKTMRACLRLCRELGVRPGAHPGFYDRENFGRDAQAITVGEFTTLLAQQAGALALLAASERVALAHIKLHGALYHMAEQSAALAKAFVLFVKENLPKVEIYGKPGGRLAALARKSGVGFRGEIYADRAYTRSGSLAPRGLKGSVLEDVDLIEARLKEWQKTGFIPALGGGKVAIAAETICIHSDSPNAAGVAKRLRGLF